jgi:hypothetical protein
LEFQRSAIGTTIVIIIVIVAVVAAATTFYLTVPQSVSTTASTSKNVISVSGLSLCPSNCVYPAPYVSAEVLINGSVPISTLAVFVNDTYDGLAFQNPTSTTIACSTASGQACSVDLGGSGSSSGTSTTITEYYATCPSRE